MDNRTIRLCYTGMSMNPLLRVPDVIGIVPYHGHKPRVGDVVVFPCGTDQGSIVHRVVTVQPGRITTRGDNNSYNDPDIDVELVIGRVVCAWRGHRCRKIHGGPAGRAWALCIALPFRTMRRLDRAVVFWLRPLYLWCAKAGFVNRLFSLQSRLRMIQIQSPDGPELQLFLGKLLIGCLSPRETRWAIRRPYRLFIAEDQLPKPSEILTPAPVSVQDS